jgi:hypothetical protein
MLRREFQTASSRFPTVPTARMTRSEPDGEDGAPTRGRTARSVWTAPLTVSAPDPPGTRRLDHRHRADTRHRQGRRPAASPAARGRRAGQLVHPHDRLLLCPAAPALPHTDRVPAELPETRRSDGSMFQPGEAQTFQISRRQLFSHLRRRASAGRLRTLKAGRGKGKQPADPGLAPDRRLSGHFL